MLYQVEYGDSPATIARKFGLTVHALIEANPHKPTVTVAGRQTWRDLHAGEELALPHAGSLSGCGRGWGAGALGFIGQALTTGSSAIVTTQTTPLNLRSAPTTSSTVIGSIPKGTRITLTGPIVPGPGSTNGWAPTTFGGKSGFAAADFLSPAPGAATPAGTVPTPSGPIPIPSGPASFPSTAPSAPAGLLPGSTAQVTTSTTSLNLRSAPTTSSTVIGSIPKGAFVTITGAVVPGPGSTKGWAPVTFQGKSGFAAADFLTPAPGAAPPPPRPPPPPPPQPGAVTPPEKAEGISTGALVAGGVGLVALVGVIAVAASSGGKKTPGRRRKAARKRR